MFVLALDLDNTALDYTGAFRRHVAAACGVDPDTLCEPETWEYHEAWKCIRDREHFVQLHNDAVNAGMFADLELMPGAAEALWKLSDAGVHIRVVTHRLFTNGHHQRTVADTTACLDARNIPYRSLCFLGDKPQVDADVYIDDGAHNIEALRAAGGDAIVFDMPYNRHLGGPRAHDWDEALELIMARYQDSQRTPRA